MIVNEDMLKDFYLDLSSNASGSKIAFTKVNYKESEKNFVKLFIYDCSKKNRLIKNFICNYSKLCNLKLVWYGEYLIIVSEDFLEIAYDYTIIYRSTLKNIRINSIYKFCDGIILQSEHCLYFIDFHENNVNLKKVTSDVICYTIHKNLIYILKIQTILVINFTNKIENEYIVNQDLSAVTIFLYNTIKKSLSCFLSDNKGSSYFELSCYGSFLNKQVIKVCNSRIIFAFLNKNGSYILLDDRNNLFKYKNYKLDSIFPDLTKIIDVYFSLEQGVLLVSVISQDGKTAIYKIDSTVKMILNDEQRTLGKFSASEDMKIIYYLNSYKGNMDWNLNLFFDLEDYNIENSANSRDIVLRNVFEWVVPCVCLNYLETQKNTVIYFVGPQHLNITSGQHQFFQHIHFSLLEF